MGISDATFYNWRKKYGGLGPSELRREATGGRERQVEAPGSRLEPGQEHAAGRAVKKALKPFHKRILIEELCNHYRASLRQACALLRMSSLVYRYKSRARDSSVLRMRIKEIAATGVHYGYRRVHVLLQREGFEDNHKRVYRLYREEGLSLRLKRPKRNKSARLRQPKHEVTAINQIWSMDFVADALFDGRRLRALAVVDNYTRESLAIEVGQNLKGEDVVNTLNRIAIERGLRATIKVDNGSEFISKAMDKWPMSAALNSTSAVRANPPTTPRWKASMVDYGRSA
nr:DDE-type integrase/transposase/recombinase [Nitrosospira briensis]